MTATSPLPVSATPLDPVELQAAQVPAYLASQGLARDVASTQARELPGGVSNRTFWVERPEGPLVLKQARARLAVALEWRADVRRILREAEAMAWLHARLGAPHIPRLLHVDRAAMVLAMEAIPPPAENYKTLQLAGQADAGLAAQWGGLLARIHNATRDDATRQAFGDATFFEQLRMSPYYDQVARVHPRLAGRLAELRRECLERTWCMVHGDYSAKNALLRQGQLVLLDYEVAHFGNPSFDLAFALTDYLCTALHLPGRGAAFCAAAGAFWHAYLDAAALPEASREQAGAHLAAVMLARVDGKSPFEYFTDPWRQQQVRALAGAVLLAGHREESTVPAVIGAVAQAAGQAPPPGAGGGL